MHTVISILLILHGTIHTIGFTEAFRSGRTRIPKIALSKTEGVLWLTTALLLITAGILAFFTSGWPSVATPALVLSQILIVRTWSSAKAGTLVNLVILLFIIAAFAANRFDHESQRMVKTIFYDRNSSTAIAAYNNAETLPLPVKKWLARSGALKHKPILAVDLMQHGTLRTTQDGTWKSFTAVQYFTVDSPSFIWLADIAYGGVYVKGRDVYYRGSGSMHINVASIFPVVNSKGAEIDQGSLLRYMAEMQWFPTAALDARIQWQAEDSLSARATMVYMGVSATGIFHFDTSGDIVAFEAKRYMAHKGSYSLETWHTAVDGYCSYDGLRVPSKGHVIWRLTTGDFEWFRWSIDSLHYSY